MKTTSYFRLYCILSCFLGYSCEEFKEWELESQEPQLVVQAILTNEFATQEVVLSQTFSTLSAPIPGVSDALVLVFTGQVAYPFVADSTAPGVYRSVRPFRIFDNLSYTLFVNWEGTLYTASSELSNVRPIREFTFQSVQDSDKLLSFALPTLAQTYNTSEQAMYEVDVDWSHLNQEAPTSARLYFYTFDELDLPQLFAPQREKISFPKGSRIYIKKYGLNEDFGAYLRAISIETDWRGQFYFAPAENVPTNLNNGALGFFSTCAVLTDTLVAQ